MPKSAAEGAVERAPRPLRPVKDPRVYYYKDRLIRFLQRICPEELAHFPPASTFTFWNAKSDDSSREYRCLEIGRVIPRGPVQEVNSNMRLFVVDRGAYDSDSPELVPYTDQGILRHSMVKALGFEPTGIFEQFRSCNRHQSFNPRLDDPLVVSLVQFIFILRDMRRYYFYSAPHKAPPQTQLAILAEALRVVTYRSRMTVRDPHPPMRVTTKHSMPYPPLNGNTGYTTPYPPMKHTAGPELPYSQASTNSRLDPRLVAKNHLTTVAPHDINTNERRADSIPTHGAWTKPYKRYFLTPAHAIVSDEATGSETMIDGPAPDATSPYVFTPTEPSSKESTNNKAMINESSTNSSSPNEATHDEATPAATDNSSDDSLLISNGAESG